MTFLPLVVRRVTISGDASPPVVLANESISPQVTWPASSA